MGAVNFQLDGGNNTAGLRGTGNPAPNPEAVQEFRVLTNGYAAEYGRYAAGVVDVVTKSGTNDFHGAAFEFFRNEKLNAKRWAPPGVTSAKDPLDRNQYGGAFGGPLEDRPVVLFRQLLGPSPGGNLLPQHAPSFPPTSSGPATSRNRRESPSIPTTRLRVSGGYHPGMRASISRQRRSRPSTFRRPICRTASMKSGGPIPLDTDEVTVKLDHNLSAGRSMAVSYFYQTGTDTQPLSLTGNIPWVDRDFKWNQHNVNFADSWVLSPNAINQFRVSYMRQFGGRVNNPTTSLGDLNSKFTIQGDPTLPRITVTGFFTGQTSIAGPDAGSNYFGVKDAMTISRGRPRLEVRRRGVVRKDRPRHAARQLWSVHVRRHQDDQRLRRLSPWPPGVA